MAPVGFTARRDGLRAAVRQDRGYALAGRLRTSDSGGIELSADAVEAFYNEANLRYERVPVEGFQHYYNDTYQIYCGDFFDSNAPLLGSIAAVYDRGALVALPPAMRHRYARHLLSLVPVACACLLICLEYDQTLVDGPPFSVAGDEVNDLFGGRRAIKLLRSTPTHDYPPRFTAHGVMEVIESVSAISLGTVV